MIAYNHYIKFIPELNQNEEPENRFSGTIIVRESSMKDFDLRKKLQHEMVFPESQGRNLSLHSDRKFVDREKGQLWVFEVQNVVAFFWYAEKKEIEYIKYNNFSEELLKYWALHVVLPTFFIIEDIYDFLHAGAVEVDKKPILFIAPSMGGKSTMTDYFMKQGHTMISDDKVATFQKDGDFYAVPSYPHHRPYRNIEDIGYFVENFAHIPRKMHVIYALESVSSDMRVSIEQLSGIEKFKSLRDAKEMNLFFHESNQLKYLTKIGKRILVFKVKVPWKLERLDEVYHAIIQHHNNLDGVTK